MESVRLLKFATYASVTTAGILIAAKLAAWLSTNSVSLLATLIDSCMDAAASIINLLAIHHAMTPADREHRFGHGKAESLAGLAQSMFIAGSAGFLILEVLDRFVHSYNISHTSVGILVMVFSIFATLALLAFQRYVIRKTGSTAIHADALHYKGDLLVNGSVILALVLANRGWTGMDSMFAVGIAIYILYNAWEIGFESIQSLMDKELPDEDRQRIKTIARNFPQVKGMHDLRTRKSGIVPFIQLHLELDDNLPLMEAHRIADGVEAAIKESFSGAEVIIHEDPASLMEPKAEFTG